jgi:formylglycine-generating enzyme required for sulfatase activity
MAELSYLDFDLSIEQEGGRYQARVLDSPAGQATHSFKKPFSKLELENFYLKVGRPRSGMRRIGSTEMQTAKEFGESLFNHIFDEEIYACFWASLNEAKSQNKGLRLRLRVNAPELSTLPWEFIYNPRLKSFLSLSVETPIVRYMELPYRTPALAVEGPLRALAMISSPHDYPALDVEREWRLLKEAVKGLEDRGVLMLERLPRASLSALQGKLRRRDVHIFHFIGHGKFDESSQDGLLLFEDDEGRGRPMSGQYLGTLLHNHRPLRLVVLNACEGARTSSEDPFAGVAQGLILQGIPAVVAMQFEVSDKAAITFGREFYSALADGYPVDAALTEARTAIFSQGNDTEWGTPVYFTRAPDGHIFDVKKEPATLVSLQDSAASSSVAPHPRSSAPSIPPVFAAWLKDRRLWVVSALIALILVVWMGMGLGGFWSAAQPTGTISGIYNETAVDTVTESPILETELPIVTTVPPVTTALIEFPEVITDNFGIPMIYIQAGSFTMGDNQSQTDEFPAHLVELDDYYIDQFEVTNSRYKACVDAGRCLLPERTRSKTHNSYFGSPQYDKFPVIYVTWEMAQTYCQWRGKRLPTEAEWERSARGTDGRLYPWGADRDCKYANTCGSDDTSPVGSFSIGASPEGLLDMAGNVWEWVEDWYEAYPGGDINASNDFGQNSRVRRGGSWSSSIDGVRTTIRGKNRPTVSDNITGFRCAISQDELSSLIDRQIINDFGVPMALVSAGEFRIRAFYLNLPDSYLPAVSALNRNPD